MQVSHLSNRSCYLTLFRASRYKPSFFSSLLLSLHFFSSLGLLLLTFAASIPNTYRADFSNPHATTPISPHLQVLGYQKREVWPVCPLQAQIKYATDLLTDLSWTPPLVQDPFWQLITIFLPLSYVKWNVLQTRYISSIASFIDCHWFYLPPLTTA